MPFDFVSFINQRWITTLKFTYFRTVVIIEALNPPNKLNLQIINTLNLRVVILAQLINTDDNLNIELIKMHRVIKLDEYSDAFADMKSF